MLPQNSDANLSGNSSTPPPNDANNHSDSSSEPREKSLAEAIAEIGKEQGGATSPPENQPPPPEDQAAATPPPRTEPEGEDATATGEQKTEDQDLPPFHNHPRFKEVLGERDEARTALATREQELEGLRPDAEFGRATKDFCVKYNIDETTLNTALELAALSVQDPKGFAAKLEQMNEAYAVQLGKRLPVDLQRKVDDGKLELSDAQEIANARIAKLQANATVQTSQRQVARSQAEAQNQQVASIAGALNQWEAAITGRDPDYKGPFKEMVQDRLENLYRRSFPQSIDQALKLANQAYSECQARMSTLRPKPALRRPSIPANGSTRRTDEITQIDDLSTDLRKVVELATSRHN